MFVKHRFLDTLKLPALEPCLYEYIFAANGIFVRAKREGLTAMIRVKRLDHPIAGLYPATPYVDIAPAPSWILQSILKESLAAAPRERLFWLLPVCFSWGLYTPEQIASSGAVRPLDPYHPRAAEATIEVHSHHAMPAFFSTTDNKDETGFKIYAVIGEIHKQPTLRVRVGIYGHFYEIPADWVFDLPDGIQCSTKREGNNWDDINE